MRVDQTYVDRQLSRLPTEVDTDARMRISRALADSSYPCPTCRPEQYELWREGHWMPNHTCKVCRPIKRRGR